MKKRLDMLLMEKGLCLSRERARALILENKVLVNGAPLAKAGHLVDESSAITLKGEDIPFVSRGGLKLDYALKTLNVNAAGKTAMDVGASTGGFTDCLLQQGARLVYAVDVGYGQLAWKLRGDPRVILIERTNIRYLDTSSIPEKIDLAVIDVSFISLRIVIPAVLPFLSPSAELLCLVKPQFEAGRKEVGKGGIVRDEKIRLHVLEEMKEFFASLDLLIPGTCQSPITGQKGNIEYFILGRSEGSRR